MNKILFLLFLLVIFNLFSSDETLDLEYFDTYKDYKSYLFKRQVDKNLDKMFEIKFEYTDKEFTGYQTTQKPKERLTIWTEKKIKEIIYFDRILYQKYKGYRIDGMYYLFYELMYPEILKEENENNNFHVYVFHHNADDTIVAYAFIYICRMQIIDDEKILSFYETSMYPGNDGRLKLREIYKFSLILTEE